MKTKLPFGSWQSPISASLAAQKSEQFSELFFNDQDFSVLWLEKTADGKTLIMNGSRQGKRPMLKSPFSAASKVHEYGGGSYTHFARRTFFINQSDQGLYEWKEDSPILLFTKEHMRFANLVYSPKREALFFIYEDHSNETIENGIGIFNIQEKTMEKLLSQHDFYMHLILCPKEEKLAFIAWDFPHMSWDESLLGEYRIDHKEQNIIYSKKKVSACFPQYHYNRDLYFLSDEDGFWNFFVYRNEETIQITHEEKDFGMANWVLGTKRYCFFHEQIIAIATIKGIDSLVAIDLASNEIDPIDIPYTHRYPLYRGEHLLHCIKPN